MANFDLLRLWRGTSIINFPLISNKNEILSGITSKLGSRNLTLTCWYWYYLTRNTDSNNISNKHKDTKWIQVNSILKMKHTWDAKTKAFINLAHLKIKVKYE